MPHGKGSTFNKGVATTTNWVEGIDERIIQWTDWYQLKNINI